MSPSGLTPHTPWTVTSTSENIRFYFFYFFHFLAVGSMWYIKLTHVSFWAHVKIVHHIVL